MISIQAFFKVMRLRVRNSLLVIYFLNFGLNCLRYFMYCNIFRYPKDFLIIPATHRATIKPKKEEDTNFVVNYKKSRDGKFKFSDSELATVYDWQDNFIDVEISGSRLRSKVSFEDNLILIHTYRGDLLFNVLPKFEVKDSGTIEGGLNAPMPGKVVEVQIKKGSSVKKGDTLIILEAMKMEHKVSDLSSGKIKNILVSKGEQVENGQTLVVLD